MGVPKFFRYMSERYPCLSELVKDYQIPEFDNLYLDMNGIIHNCSHPNDDDPHFRITEEVIFNNIFHYLEVLFQMIQPQKLFFMAVDGVAPRAKMNQQRGRRFRSAHVAAEQMKAAIIRGETLPTSERFDSNCITPGTEFMVRLQNELEYFVNDKVSNDPLWSKVQVILSGHQVPGEGEHKIMDYIRYMKSQPNYDSNTRHCLYGLDADLIMLGLCTHEPYFSLLREEVKFDRKAKRETSVDETKFYLLHLSLMRDYLDLEFQVLKEVLPFKYDLESIIDDWVLMGFLIGNDFIPHLPDLHISKGALPILYKVYMDVLPQVGGYLNEKGSLNLKRFQIFMKSLANFDYDQFRDTFADIKYLEGKRTANGIETSDESDPAYKDELATLIKDTEKFLLSDDDEDGNEESSETEEEAMMAEFTLHKENYYRNKLEYNVITEDVMRSQAKGYIRAIQWNLNYYYNGCCSWSWYYPHHYAPYISDIKDFENIQLEFDLGQPFLPFQQLLAVLPSLSKELLPKPFQDLMIEEASPIRMYYPEQFETDLNGKQHEWEAVVLVPFIDEETLLKSMKMVEHKLSDDEKKRNSHGPMYLFKYTKENMGIVSNSKYFPPIQESHAHRILINREDIAVDPNDLVKGLCPNVNLDVYHVGFPTLHLIPITAELLKKGVKVFQSSSLSENMIIKIINQDENIEGNIQSIAKELLGKTVYANWPHLEEIKVTAISSKSLLLSLDDNEHVIVRDMDDSAVQEFKLLSQGFAKTYMSTRGIDIGKTSILLRGQKLKGTKYIPRQDGSGVDLVKAWCEIPSTVAFQTAVLDLEVNDPHIKQSYFALEEYFPVGGNVFVLDAPFYGCQAEVIGGYISSRIKIDITLTPEPYFYDLRDTLNSVSIEMFNANAAAAQLALSPYLLAKLTGTIFLMVDSEEDRHEKKINIGMSLKFNKRNEEVIGYTKKVEKYWLYSQKTIDLLREYLERFPELQNLVNTESANDTFRIEEMFPDKQTRKEKLEKLKSWIAEMRSLTKQKQTFGSMEPCKVAVLENYMDDFIEINSKHKKIISLNVKSQNLLKPVTKLDKLKADEDADTRVLDRVVCIRSSYQVPLGYKGTVISINKSNVDTETVYSVIFDKEFANGVSLGGSPNRGYKLCRMSFINLSHAIRTGLYKPLVVKVPISQRSNTEKQNTQMSIWEHLQSNSKNSDKISKNTESKFTLASKESWRRQQLQNESNSIMNSNISQKQGQPVEELKKTQSSQNYNNNKSNNSSLLNADACEFTTLALKKMLKIQPEDNSIIKNKSKLESTKSFSSAPSGSSYNSKEQMTENNFSRNNDNSIPYFPAEPSTSMTAALESFYISKGYGTPRYSFTNKVDKNMKLYSASVLLPNGITLPGEVKPTHTEATEDVAARALIIIKKIESNQNKAEQVISNNFSQKINPRLVSQQEIAKQIPQQQAPPNAYMNWISSYPHQSYQQPIPQQSVQYFKGPQIAYQQFQPQQFLAQYAPNYQVPRQSYHLPFVSQPTFTQQNVVSGYSLPSQQYFNYPQEMQYSKPVPTVFPNIVNPAQLPQPPIHWQATPRNVPTANNEILINPLQQTYQSHTTISHPTYTRSVPKEMLMNDSRSPNNRVIIPSPSSAFTSAATSGKRKIRIAANFNTPQQQ